MKYLYLFLICFVNINAQSKLEDEISRHLTNLPFETPKISAPVFNNQNYNVKDFGAVGNGEILNTIPINTAIKTCSGKGGGHVIIPPGIWKTGPLKMESNVDLHLEKGALVVFTEDHTQYPLLKLSSNNYEVMNPIYGKNLENISITGEGIFDGNGQTWRPVKKGKLTEAQWKELINSGGVLNEKKDMWWPSAEALEGEKYLSKKKKQDLTIDDFEKVKDYLRPYMLYFEKAKNVFLDGVTFQNSPKFAVDIKYCENVIVRNVTVMNEWWAQNGDGLDISACRNVLIYNCLVNAGDDGICLKSSKRKGEDFALENVIIDDCTVYHGHGGFVIGSNTDGGIRNVVVRNCNFTWTDIGLRFKSGTGRGGIVENIFIDGIYMKDIKNECISFDLVYTDAGAVKMEDDKIDKEKIPQFRNVRMNNIYCDGAAAAFSVNKSAVEKVEDIQLTNSAISSNEGISLSFVNNLTMDNMSLNVRKSPALYFNESGNILVKKLKVNENVELLAKIEGIQTKNIVFKNSHQFKDAKKIVIGTNTPLNTLQIQN